MYYSSNSSTGFLCASHVPARERLLGRSAERRQQIALIGQCCGKARPEPRIGMSAAQHRLGVVEEGIRTRP